MTVPYEKALVSGDPSGSIGSHISVVIPCHRVKKHILKVIKCIGPECHTIIVVDDKCPENTGDYVEANNSDPRVRVVRHERNQGVGGATMTGYHAAITAGAQILVKIDGDDQMDSSLIRQMVRPIQDGYADFTKGNRFFYPETLTPMPTVRILGNMILTFLSKISSGNWHIADPTNGYTAIHASVASLLLNVDVAKDYFFESDMLYHLNGLRAVIVDVPMHARYGDEASGLRITRIVHTFLVRHLRNLLKRITRQYFLRDFNIASIQLIFGILLCLFGFLFGSFHWIRSLVTGTTASSGTVMAAAFPLIVGFQCLIGFLSYDVQNLPKVPLHKLLGAEIAHDVHSGTREGC